MAIYMPEERGKTPLKNPSFPSSKDVRQVQDGMVEQPNRLTLWPPCGADEKRRTEGRFLA